jgi:hypothetical protein
MTQKIQSFPQATHPEGTHVSQSIPTPTSLTKIAIECDVSQLTDSNIQVEYFLEVSSDNGLTWKDVIGGRTQGESPMVHTPMGIYKTFNSASQLHSLGSLIRGKLIVKGGSAVLGPGTVTLD